MRDDGCSFGVLVILATVGCAGPMDAHEANLGKELGALYVGQQSKLISQDPWNGDGLGNAVAIDDGRALIGCSGDDRSGPIDEGAAYVFEPSGDQWFQRAKLIASDAEPQDRLGNAVAISGDTALVAASGRDEGGNNDQGAVYVFVNAGGSWVEHQKLVAEDGVSGEAFGRAIAFEGDTAVVGADGSARVFLGSEPGFDDVQKLSPPTGANAVTFGRTVALSGDTLLVGSSGDTIGPNAEQGAVYVYARSGAGFTLEQRLVATDGQDLEHFGTALAISQDNVVIGIDSTKPSTGGIGAAYVFGRSEGSFSQRAKLTASDATEDDHFGRAVATLGEFVVVGAPLHEEGGLNANHGSAYVFRGADAVWTEAQEIRPNDAQNNDFFGSAIALDVGIALIGSPNDDVPFMANGSAYTFRFEGFVGEPCTSAFECMSGFCSEGVCCNTACSGACDACTVARGGQVDGFCAPVPAGSPGEPVCALTCTGVLNDCPTAPTCSTDAGCSSAEYCQASGVCLPRKTLGSACSTSAGADCLEEGCRVCSGGACIDGTCNLGVCASNVHCDTNPCQHGGVCTDIPTGHVCACPPGVNGLDCEVVFTQLSGGHYDMCGLRSDGKIACWGNHSVEVPIATPAGTFKWVSLSQHLCAVRTDGTVLCSGYGATAPPPYTFKSVFAGDMRACGIRTDDTAVCWGGGSFLGEAAAPPGTFRALALGEGYTCGIRTNGTVQCWGLQNPPPGLDVGQADPPSGLFTAISTQLRETCGITGGGITCWGTPSGLGSLPGNIWSTLGNGFSSGCALRSDGFLMCSDSARIPGARIAFSGGVTSLYKAFAVTGSGSACGLRLDDAVTCWGAETLTAPPTGTL